jgi:hypothetical protein
MPNQSLLPEAPPANDLRAIGETKKDVSPQDSSDKFETEKQSACRLTQ